ncbi:helix-turn-helix domain-containing protein [Mycobacterium sp. SMC-18]|uniref:helix-turn-helix domain-containing protein n=1 Tax=Mycobacterium TaxID=1763 RepID=UPI000CDE2A93|nr:ImmA/IrrE family metallo-endopeptidase [Mycobacterium kansasii]POX75450.1 XRE family transcriptional regulator [Mycobacterium kansasii]POY13683.1 XRE family transcriptional regulator [Mycobacterium kansasii]
MSEVVAHPRLVSLVREARGWSQTDLAEAAGVSQGFVSKVESGLLDLRGEHLTAVAAALDCPPQLLVDDTPVQGLEVTCLHHRRRHSKMTAATKRRIEAITHLTRVSVEGLLHGIEIVPQARLERMDIDEFGTPETVARELRIRWRVPSGPIANVVGLLEAVGVIVVMRPLGTTAQDAVSTWPHDPDRPPIMVLNRGLPADRQRFTTMHEAGHLVMHSVPGDYQEREADRFAAEFLAPADEIVPLLTGLTTAEFPRLMQLKAQWGISIAALIRRAYDLDLISERQYREFQIKLGRLGWRTVEPGTLPGETPRTLNSVIDVHVTDHDYSVHDLARAAVMTDDAFTRNYLVGQHDSPRTRLRVVAP